MDSQTSIIETTHTPEPAGSALLPILSLENIQKSFGQRHLLSDASFSLEKGRTLALCGASGCGKTTLVKIISGLMSFDGGSFCISGTRVVSGEPYPKSLFGTIGVVFQEHNLFPHLSAHENVALALKCVRKIPAKAANDRALHELSRVGLADCASRHPRALSGGERQRVAIARALALDPILLLLDEPTASLDAKRIDELRAILRLLKDSDVAMMLVTHNIPFACDMADRFCLLENGHITSGDSPTMFDTLRQQVWE